MLFTTNTGQNNGRPSPDTHSHSVQNNDTFDYDFLCVFIFDVVLRVVLVVYFHLVTHTKSAHPSAKGRSTLGDGETKETHNHIDSMYICLPRQ